MLITLSYVYLWLRFHRTYPSLIRETVLRLQRGPRNLALCFCRGPSTAASQRPLDEEEGLGLFLQRGDCTVYVTEPQVRSDLSSWTVLHPSSAPLTDHISFIIEATAHRAPPAHKHQVGWSDLCVPLAHCPMVPGQPYQALAQASVEDFSRLGVAFLEERLQLEAPLWPSRILPVCLEPSVLAALQKQVPQCLLSVDQAPLLCRTSSLPPEPRPHSLYLPPDLSPLGRDERRASEPLLCPPQSQQPGGHMEEHGHGPLHLASCHECLELENSTILSVKYASAENIPELPDDGAGDGGSDSGAAEIPEDYCSSADANSKPPNVLIYTGESEARYRSVQRLLSTRISAEKYLLYRLMPQQALSDPWLEQCCLLVVAEDAEDQPLSDHLQTRFLTFLSAGGRVLGLCSGLCPAGVALVQQQHQHQQQHQQQDQRRTMRFTREDSSSLELRVQTSDRLYARDVRGGGEVELWGELSGGGMAVIRVTHGDDGGEAVLCQVRLEEAPEDPEGLEVLEEILSSLGVSCEPCEAPRASPVHLLSTSTEAKRSFVAWLRTQADDRGLLRLPKACLRLVSCSEAGAELDPVEGPVSLLWDSSEAPCPESFSLQTYRSHLRTKQLGRTVLYADVVSSTMDMLDGWNIRLPSDVGLVAVAARQSQGRGRSRNGWLSPLGCAMFTVCLQVSLSSRLGQRIPFLQHLMALAVVLAVRTLPGYEDVDLRVKWPNDIYHSSGQKLGGVLVTSTVLGSSFHLLVGCGFNVTNSSPTVCINDLVQRHNLETGSSLGPLSTSQLIARSLTQLEELVSRFQSQGPDAVLPAYYSHWLHSGSRVRLWSEEGPEVEVVGLDQNGFLQVLCPERGLLSLEPDGNSFDMLKNLLVMKHH
ncbi:unnamed protein product [Knipowitschia caucasica]|uniref:BPL/LPL catalytic domain-containing protein n=1 Tax=Knipowitschia caucasica TaxID=637954 RepID=A0AAV2J7X8_KNICA